jgi:hypothetical protein
MPAFSMLHDADTGARKAQSCEELLSLSDEQRAGVESTY